MLLRSRAWAAGRLAGQAFVCDRGAGRKLDSVDPKQRYSALELLFKSGPGPFQTKLSALLLGKEAGGLHSVEPIYKALFRSSDPATADTIRRSFAEGLIDVRPISRTLYSSAEAASLGCENCCWNLPAPKAQRGTALERLGKWGDAALQRGLVTLCLKEYERRLSKSRPAGRNTDPELNPCDRYLGTLAGRNFLLNDRPAIRPRLAHPAYRGAAAITDPL